MVFDILSAVLILVMVTLTGVVILPRFNGIQDQFRLFLSSLTGLATLMCLAAWFATLGLSLKLYWICITVFLVIVASIRRIAVAESIRSICFGIRNRFIIFIFLLASLVAPLHNNSLIDAQLSFRNGPDLVGWTAGAQFFCQNLNMNDFKSHVTDQLGATSFLNTLRFPPTENTSFLYRISSLTDQVNSEFLLGAHRTGAPAMLGSFCQGLPGDSIFHLIVGLQIAIIFLIMLMIHHFLEVKKFNGFSKWALVVISGLNIGLLSVLFEGGLGQILMLPYLAFFLFTIFTRSSIKYLALFLGCLIAFSTYFDFLYFFIPMAVILILSGESRTYRTIKYSLVRILAFIVASLALNWQIITSIPRIVNERFFGHPGGWNMGRPPTPLDVFGLINWLPSDSVTVFTNQSNLLLLTSVLSILFIWLFLKYNFLEYKVALIIYLIFYVALFLKVYSDNALINNYPLFKSSPYFALFLPFLLFGHCRFLEEDNFRGRRAVKKQKKHNVEVSFGAKLKGFYTKKIFASLVTLSMISSSSWSYYWVQNRQFSFESATAEALKPLLPKYDFVAGGFTGAGYAKLALLGDLHLMNGRGFDIIPNKSVPLRSTAFLFPPEVCRAANTCSVEYQGIRELKLLTRTSDLEVYVEKYLQ